MKVKIRILLDNPNLVTAVAYGEGTNFHQKATARVERTANGKARVSVDSTIFFYDENMTEPEEPYIQEVSTADIKTLAINKLLEVVTNGTIADVDIR